MRARTQRQPDPVHLEPAVFSFVRIRHDADAHRRRGHHAQRGLALEHRPSAALELVHRASVVGHLDLRRLAETAGEAIRQVHGTAAHLQGQRDRRVVGRPMRADLVVDLVFRGEPGDVRRVARTEVESDHARAGDADERGHQGSEDQHGRARTRSH
jgi:hypothetical protein